MRGVRTSRGVIVHFLWTLSIAGIAFRISSTPFQFVILFNAAFAAGFALARGESLSARKLTLWDEAVAFIGVAAAANLLR